MIFYEFLATTEWYNSNGPKLSTILDLLIIKIIPVALNCLNFIRSISHHLLRTSVTSFNFPCVYHGIDNVYACSKCMYM